MDVTIFKFRIRDVYTGNWLPITVKIIQLDDGKFSAILTDSEGMDYSPDKVVHPMNT